MFKQLKQIFNSTTELHRAAMEYGGLQLSWPSLKEKLPNGDGHPVLFLPGFLTSDAFTFPLRNCVAEKGYKVYGWDNGFNLGFDERTAEHLKNRLQAVFAENGGQKVTLVGHSLGGVYARELAREFPEMVRDVITLGTPFGMLHDPAAATSQRLEQIYKFFQPNSIDSKLDDIGARGLTPPPVPATSLYSQDDGVVDWKAALNPKTAQTENIEVTGSHMGMVANTLTVTAVLDRLAQKEGDWKPFDKAKYAHLHFPKGANDNDIPANPNWQQSPKSLMLFKNRHPKP